jgi:hypothetical protein
VNWLASDLAQAEALCREAFNGTNRPSDRPQSARLLLAQANLYTDLGRPPAALDALNGAPRLYRAIGEERSVAWASLRLAQELWRQRPPLCRLARQPGYVAS